VQLSVEKVTKTGINCPVLEPDNEFWNRVRVPGSFCKSLVQSLPIHGALLPLLKCVINLVSPGWL